MEKQVIFRDRQELQSADLNAIQHHTSESLRHMIKDAVGTDLVYTGGVVAAASATEITVAELRFYADGQSYTSETAQTLNLFQYLPLVTKKCVALVVWGQDVETNVEPRDFLIDLTTGATQPSAVAMQRLNQAKVNLIPGAESADPQPPTIQSNTLTIAYIYLTSTGIERIEMQMAARMPHLSNHEQRVRALESWQAQAEPRISSIATDLAGLASKTEDKADRHSIVSLAADIAALKEKITMPASVVTYTSNYGDNDQSYSAGTGYSARVEDAIMFDYAASARQNLALFNPIDASVRVAGNGLMLPDYTSVPRIATKGYAGDVPIAGYQTQAIRIGNLRASVVSIHCGLHANHHGKWYARHGWDKYGSEYDFNLETFGYRQINPKDPYTLDVSTTSLSGALLAQTVLVSNAMWLTQIGLSFTAIASSGDVTVALTETTSGKPDLSQTLTLVTVSRSSLQSYPVQTVIDVPPVLLSAGKRYAVVVLSQGNHRLALVDGGPNTQGKLFYGQDGDYVGYNGKYDLLFTLFSAQFDSPRTEVMLQALSLSGGMTDIQINAQHVNPKGCEFHYEIQPTGSGAWYRLGDPIHLSAGPNLVNLRAVFVGTSDLSPAVVLTENAILISRPAEMATWWSTERVVPTTTSVVLSALVSGFESAHHVLSPKIVISGAEYNPSSTISTDDEGAKRFTYRFTVPSTTAYKIKLGASRNAGSNPFSIVELIDAVE